MGKSAVPGGLRFGGAAWPTINGASVCSICASGIFAGDKLSHRSRQDVASSWGVQPIVGAVRWVANRATPSFIAPCREVLTEPEPTMSHAAALLPRRKVFGVAAGAGALVAAAAVLPPSASSPPDIAEPKAQPEQRAGYQLTQHVLRYYETTRL